MNKNGFIGASKLLPLYRTANDASGVLSEEKLSKIVGETSINNNTDYFACNLLMVRYLLVTYNDTQS